MRARRGFALMAALWLLVMIAALSLELSVTARGRRLSAANVLEGAQAELAASSAIEHARARLTLALGGIGSSKTWNDPRAILDPWYTTDLGLPDSIHLRDNVWYRATVEPLGAKININRSSEEDLRRYFEAMSLDVVRVEDAVQGIMDWRDPDDFPRERGAERDIYMKAGARELPRNAAFESVEELRFVHGVTPELLARIRGDLTILGSGQIDVNVAPERILRSLPGITEAAAQAIMQMQHAGRRIESVQQLTDLLPASSRAALERALPLLLPRVTFDVHEVAVVGEGWMIGSPVRVTETAVIARGGDAAFVIWRQRE